MSQSGSQRDRRPGLACRKPQPYRKPEVRQRRLKLEKLEERHLLASYTYPYGATQFDTGEYMLGDVAVNVVLMESDPSLAPFDNNPITNPPATRGIGAPEENWTAISIAAVKANISAGLQWWKDTLVNMFPNAPANLLNFHINWQYADDPVETGYEPIARVSDDFYIPQGTAAPKGWIYDFLNKVGFNATRNFSADVRAFNDFSRQVANTDWAFTIFVVNNAADADKEFAPGGSFAKAFAYAGGRFMVVPASRPASTYAHETGHEFMALDQYDGSGAPYNRQRGYYNTPNTNAPDNPTAGYVRQNSIMSRDESQTPQSLQYLTNAFNNHTSDKWALAQVGWQDSDLDGIFDVLDVPFSLSGSGVWNPATGLYTFTGSTVVRTLPNANSDISSGGRSITINQINVIQASIDGGPWQTVQGFPSRTYETSLDFSVPLGTTGIHEIRLRSADLRTGVTSGVFTDDVETPTDPPWGVNGIVFRDLDSDGARDAGEPPLPDVGLEVLDQDDQPLDFVRFVEPSEFPVGWVLNGVAVDDGVTLSAVGANVSSSDVYARTSTIAASAGKVFGPSGTGTAGQVWNEGQRLRVDFAEPVATVSLRAFGGLNGGSTFARLEAYDSSGTLLTRFNTGALSTGSATTMTVSRIGGDIKYVVAYGRHGTNVVLDTLQWGAATSATSNTNGAYSLAGLPDGSYRIRVTPPAGYVVTVPSRGYANVTVSGGQSLGVVDFGISTHQARPFHNVGRKYNVSDDVANIVSSGDVLMVINFLNAFRGAEGEIADIYSPQVVGFIDVTGDGLCAPNDALAVINYINSGGSESEGELGSGAASGGETGGGPEAEGELRVTVPRSAADYYAQNPVQPEDALENMEPCSCAACVGARTDAALTEYQPQWNNAGSEEDTFLSLAGLLSSGGRSIRELQQPRDSSALPLDQQTAATRWKSLIALRGKAAIGETEVEEASAEAGKSEAADGLDSALADGDGG